jgi:hypothetical protein
MKVSVETSGERVKGRKTVRTMDWRSAEDIEKGQTSLNYFTGAYPSVVDLLLNKTRGLDSRCDPNDHCNTAKFRTKDSRG